MPHARVTVVGGLDPVLQAYPHLVEVLLGGLPLEFETPGFEFLEHSAVVRPQIANQVSLVEHLETECLCGFTPLLPMLTSMGMDTSRVGFLGWSMGGYGALLLGARLGPARTAGICAISPALFTSFTGSTPGAFDSYDDYVQHSVLGLPALNSIPLRVDCGTSDRFYFATRQFVNQLHQPPAGSFSPGGHDASYWREQLPGELAWMAS